MCRRLLEAGELLIVEIEMSPDETKLMDTSIEHVKELVGLVKKLYPEL